MYRGRLCHVFARDCDVAMPFLTLRVRRACTFLRKLPHRALFARCRLRILQHDRRNLEQDRQRPADSTGRHLTLQMGLVPLLGTRRESSAAHLTTILARQCLLEWVHVSPKPLCAHELAVTTLKVRNLSK